MLKLKWLVLAIVVITVGLVIGFWPALEIFYQNWNQDVKEQPAISQITPDSYIVSYDLPIGWNFIAFPIKPVNFRTASGLILDVAKSGGYVTTVSMWDKDKWVDFSQRGENQYGHDFAIEPGVAYFVQNHKPFVWEVIGPEVKKEELSQYALHEGWNTIGLLDESFKAVNVIDQINQGVENATVIDWWTTAGNWELFVKRIYSGEDIREYGENFPIVKTRGYMIKLEQPTNWRPAYEQ